MTVVAGFSKEFETINKFVNTFFFYRVRYTVDLGINHRNIFCFRSVGLYLVRISQNFIDFACLEFSQFPVAVNSGEPKLRVMKLNFAHQLAETGLIIFLNLR